MLHGFALQWNLIRDKWTRLEEFGILEEALLDTLWHEALDQKLLLLGLLEKFDLVCQRLPSVAEVRAIYFLDFIGRL